MPIEDIMRLSPVIPVLVVSDVARARPMAQALVAAGHRALEVTLRTPEALEVIHEMSRVEGAVVGAGTVLSAQDLDASLSAGRGSLSARASPSLSPEPPAPGARPICPVSPTPLTSCAAWIWA